MRSSISALMLVTLLAPCIGRAETTPAAETPPPTELPVAAEKASATDAPPAPDKHPAAAEAEVSHREIAGHVFIPSHFVLTPFSVTSVGMSLAGGFGTANGPVIDLMTGAVVPGETKGYPFSAIGPSIDLSIRIFDFLDVRANMLALLFSGLSGEAALVVGSGFQISGDLGVTGGFDLGKNVRLGFTFDFDSTPQFNILVAAGIKDAIASGQVPNPSDFLSKTNTLTIEPGAVVAWAPWPYIGGTLNLQYLHPSKTGTSSSALNGVTLAALIDFDLMQLVHEVPIGFTAVYKWTAPIGADGVSSSQDITGGIFYTGRPALALGLELGERIFRIQNDLKSTATLFYLTVQYYW